MVRNVASLTETIAPGRALGDLVTARHWGLLAQRLALSPRELEMIRAACHDESVTALARELSVSPHTIHTYRERLYRKLQVRSFSQVMVVSFTVLTEILISEAGEAEV